MIVGKQNSVISIHGCADIKPGLLNRTVPITSDFSVGNGVHFHPAGVRRLQPLVREQSTRVWVDRLSSYWSPLWRDCAFDSIHHWCCVAYCLGRVLLVIIPVELVALASVVVRERRLRLVIVRG